MLDRACGIAAIPTEPYESAQIDGASLWQMFRYITFALITPFLFIRCHDPHDRCGEEF